MSKLPLIQKALEIVKNDSRDASVGDLKALSSNHYYFFLVLFHASKLSIDRPETKPIIAALVGDDLLQTATDIFFTPSP
jgi:hypothetical protein